MAAFRLWLQEPPGSPNCPAGFPNCINSGSYDPAKSPMCSDPRQFANFQEMLAHAESRGEQLRQTTTAAEALSICNLKTDGSSAAVVLTNTTLNWLWLAFLVLIVLLILR